MAKLLSFDEPIRQRRFIRFGRSRFSWLILSFMLITSVGVGVFIQRLSFAATGPTYTTVSGRVTDATTGFGLPNITLSLCHEISVVTNSNGEWSISLIVPSRICTFYVSGATSAVTASSAINLPPDASVRHLYQYQITGNDCYHNTTNPLCDYQNQAYDRGVDTGYDLKLTLAVPYTPPPTPVPTLTPVPTPIPQPTATLAPGSTPKPVSNPAGQSTPTPRPAGQTTNGVGKPVDDTTPPATPTALKAVSAATNALVTLTWDAGQDNVGVTAYELDRSLNGQEWSTVAKDIKGTTYQDTSVAYNLTYTYRLKALDAKGSASPYAIIQAKTAEFVTNTSADTALSYTSDDGSATLYVLAGTFSEKAQCSVISGGWGSLKLDSGSAILAGPYQLLCKNSLGNIISSFGHEVRWTITHRTSELDLSKPQVYRINANGKPEPTGTATYDGNTKAFTYTQSANDKIIVLASQKSSSTVITAIVVTVIVIFLAAGVTFISLQRKRITMYRNYLRDKYYNM